MNQEMMNTLDNFFSEKTIQDVDRNTFLVCNLNDKPRDIIISLVFMRDWETDDYSDYNQIILKNKGAIFIFPSYWVSIPKKLAISYFEYLLDQFYKDEVSTWDVGGDLNTGTGDSGSFCPCNN